jgi:DNA-binding transcriptional LysR family regulator
MIEAADGPLLVAFAAVARLGSFSAAAAALKLSKSVISERVKQLEERCGARLLERTTRRLRLTDAGAEVLDAATRIEDALGLLSRSLEVGRSEPSGLLRVSTTNDLGPLLVGPTVARFVTAYPKVRVELLAEDAPRELLETKIDVAVRMGAPKASSFVARKLAVLNEPIVASPALAGRLGMAARPGALLDAPWVKHSLLVGNTLSFTGPNGQTDAVAPSFRAETNSGSTLLSLLLHGAGVGVLPEHALREHLQTGRLMVLCPGWVWKQVALFALVPSRASLSPAHRAFLAMLQEQLRRDRSRWGAGLA